MEGRHRHVEPRQQEGQRQGSQAEQTQEARGDRVGIGILGGAEQQTEVHRGQIAHGQTVHEQADPPGQQAAGELVRPLGILQQRQGQTAPSGHGGLHGGWREQVAGVETGQPVLQPGHDGRVRQPLNVDEGDVRSALPPRRRLPDLEALAAQVAAEQAGVGAGGLAEGVLRPARGALDLRFGGAALLSGLDLEGQGNALRQTEDGKAVEQAADRVGCVGTALRHRAADRAADRRLRQLIRGSSRKAGQRADHGLGDLAARGQTVQKIENAVLPADAQPPAAEVRRAGKSVVDLRRADRLRFRVHPIISFFVQFARCARDPCMNRAQSGQTPNEKPGDAGKREDSI